MMRAFRKHWLGFSFILAVSLAAVGRPAAAQTIRTLIGAGNQDGLFRNQVVLSGPTGLALDADASLYVTEAYPPRVLKIGRDARITNLAGTGVPGRAGDGGPATP